MTNSHKRGEAVSMLNRQHAQKRLYIALQRANQTSKLDLASLRQPALSMWQSAILVYASVKCGIKFTSIDQTDRWLRMNPHNPQHLTVDVVLQLLLVEPPRDRRKSSPPTAA